MADGLAPELKSAQREKKNQTTLMLSNTHHNVLLLPVYKCVRRKWLGWGGALCLYVCVPKCTLERNVERKIVLSIINNGICQNT